MDLSLDRLSVTLGTRRVLHEIGATLRPGRITAILGANGSGKSTLVRTLAGLLVPETGEALLAGTPVSAMEPRARARALGYLPQDASVHWNVTVEHLVALGRLPHRAAMAGLSPEDYDAIAEAMAATDTVALAGRPVGELSGGERARVLLARVLAGRPAWLLADEPLAALDPAHQLDLLAQLCALAGAGMGVAIVLHDLVQAARLADDVLLLRDGRLVASGAAEQVLAPAPLAEAFGVEVMMVEDREGRRLPVAVGRSEG